MNKVFRGRRYDTDTAKELASWYNDEQYGGIYYRAEKLYQKRTGEYFMYYEGGAGTEYAEADPMGGYTMGEAIEPVTEEEAKAWAEDHIDADKYEEIFGRVYDNKKVDLHIFVHPAMRDNIKKEAVRRGLTVTELVEKELKKAGY